MQTLLQAVSLVASSLYGFDALSYFPAQNATVSYWMAHNRGPSNYLLGRGREHAMPTHADVIMLVFCFFLIFLLRNIDKERLKRRRWY